MQYCRDCQYRRLASFLFVNTYIFRISTLRAFCFPSIRVYLKNLSFRLKKSGSTLSARYLQRPWVILRNRLIRERLSRAVTFGSSQPIKSNRFRFAWGEKVSCRVKMSLRGERASCEVLASIQRTYERTCRHRRSYIEISAKETKARGTTREAVSREAPCRAGKKLIRFCKPATGALCVSKKKWFPIYISTDLLLS